MNNVNLKLIEDNLSICSNLGQEVLIRYYGLFGQRKMSLQQISSILGLPIIFVAKAKKDSLERICKRVNVFNNTKQCNLFN